LVIIANSITNNHHPPQQKYINNTQHYRNNSLIKYSVTQGGFLVGGRFLDYRETNPADPKDAECLEWRRQFTEVCQQFDASPYDVAVAFGVSHPAVTCVALSTSKPDRVESMVSAATNKPAAAIWTELRDRGLISPAYPHLVTN
jgi:aryl-alcohol dehydrogenase-like predicted oxidoreductase